MFEMLKLLKTIRPNLQNHGIPVNVRINLTVHKNTRLIFCLKFTLSFYKNTWLIFCSKFKNNPSLSRRARSQILS